MISVDRFTKSAQEVAQRAAEIMQRYSHNQIDAEHQLLALIEQPQGGIPQLLEFLKVDANALSERLDYILRTGPKGDIVDVGPGRSPLKAQTGVRVPLGTSISQKPPTADVERFLSMLRVDSKGKVNALDSYVDLETNTTGI